MHRIIVIGRGMIGSAAGRHLAGLTDGVALLGPDEPVDRTAHAGVFASHYDEGRMTRVVDPDPNWSITAKRSIERYAEIEAESGIPFFTNSQFLGLGAAGSDYLANCETHGRANGADTLGLDADGIRARYPFLRVADDAEGLHEGRNAGHISPRAMVRAECEAARRRGAQLIAGEARAIRPVTGGVEIEDETGTIYKAEKVLIATGGFTDVCGLAPRDLRLRVFGRTVVLVRIEADVARELAGMPTMSHAETGAYILPPIRYPDGHTYLKIGIGTTDDPEFRALADLKVWFKSEGSATNRRDFQGFLTTLIPVLARCDHWHTATCAVTWTATGLPYIDYALDNRIALAVGGNGKGAKSCDDWGWIAAEMLAGREWSHPIPRERLELPAGLT